MQFIKIIKVQFDFSQYKHVLKVFEKLVEVKDFGTYVLTKSVLVGEKVFPTILKKRWSRNSLFFHSGLTSFWVFNSLIQDAATTELGHITITF